MKEILLLQSENHTLKDLRINAQGLNYSVFNGYEIRAN